MAKRQEIVFEKDEEISKGAETKIREILTNEGVKSSIDIGFVEYEEKRSTKEMESESASGEEEVVITIRSGDEEEYISKHKGENRVVDGIHFIEIDAVAILKDQNR